MWNFIIWIWQRYLWVRRPDIVILGLMALTYVLMYPLYCLSYRIPGLAVIAERYEDIVAIFFAPLRAIDHGAISGWLANGFSGSALSSEGTTIWWVWAFQAVALMTIASLIATIGAFLAHAPGSRPAEIPCASDRRRRWMWTAVTVVVLLGIVPYIAFRVYVNLSVARHVESYINGTSSHDNPLAAYPEETFDYVIRTLDPENSERCRLSQHLLASLFYHGCHLDSDIVKQHESLFRHCMTSTVERFDENDSPEETRRKCRELKEWWDRY